LFSAAKQIAELFKAIQTPEVRKPVIAILGDMYAKFNTVLNDDICEGIESLGGEVLLPSYNELVLHVMHADVVENDQDGRLLATMTRYEHSLENIFKDLINDRFEPALDECTNLLKEFGLENFIAGETAISVGRLLYYIKYNLVDAVIHVNPLLCCPGVISASIFKNIQDRYRIPVIDLFYDGTNKPNKMIEPLMFYLSSNS
jgi:predicted nucleotide-binding protein (sugar kinase/HSP70/actin superfamily)